MHSAQCAALCQAPTGWNPAIIIYTICRVYTRRRYGNETSTGSCNEHEMHVPAVVQRRHECACFNAWSELDWG